MQITDQKVEIALRKWWDLEPNQPLPWDTAPVDLHHAYPVGTHKRQDPLDIDGETNV